MRAIILEKTISASTTFTLPDYTFTVQVTSPSLKALETLLNTGFSVSINRETSMCWIGGEDKRNQMFGLSECAT